ncbi:MAG: hypothetical protein IGNPGNKH_00725 [Sodalis sp. Ffu]|nr:MAG: hypothetical protein IGNPGNKH_00725 [Sodalis sp. Ffu]
MLLRQLRTSKCFTQLMMQLLVIQDDTLAWCLYYKDYKQSLLSKNCLSFCVMNRYGYIYFLYSNNSNLFFVALCNA